MARSVDPVSVASTMASASTGGLTSVAPHENSTFLTGTPSLLEVALRDLHELGGDDGARQILRRLEARVLRGGQHPAHLAEALFRVDEVGEAA